MSQAFLNHSASAKCNKVWQEWLAENLLRGVDPKKLTTAMVQNRFDHDTATKYVNAVLASPIYKAALRTYRSRRKLESLFDALSAQYRQSGYADNIVVREGLSAEEFYERFYFANRPVIVRGLMAGWDALRLWTPSYFAAEFGDRDIEITSARDDDERYEENFAQHCSTVRMRDFVRMIQDIETNDYYLVAKNNLLEQEEFRQLYQHFSCPPGYLDPTLVERHVKMWLGPKGTITPLHHDACNLLFGQIYGRKRVQLIPPYDLNNVYNDRACFSSVELEDIDYKKFPRMLDVSIFDVVIEPGDFILLPLGWWHWVKSLDVSISLTFSNFAVEGSTIVWRYT